MPPMNSSEKITVLTVGHSFQLVKEFFLQDNSDIQKMQQCISYNQLSGCLAGTETELFENL